MKDIQHSVGKVAGLILSQFGVPAAVPFSGVIDDDIRVTVPGVMNALALSVTPPGPEVRVLDGVLFGDDKRVMKWMHDQVGRPPLTIHFTALGIIGDGTAGGSSGLIAGAYFTNHKPNQDVWITLYSTSPVAGRPEAISTVFDYAFAQLDVPRISADIDASNTRMIDVATRLGFELEGRKRKGGSDGGDAFYYGLLRDDALARGVWKPMPPMIRKAA